MSGSAGAEGGPLLALLWDVSEDTWGLPGTPSCESVRWGGRLKVVSLSMLPLGVGCLEMGLGFSELLVGP